LLRDDNFKNKVKDECERFRAWFEFPTDCDTAAMDGIFGEKQSLLDDEKAISVG
jgi:hypothetical protein